jgi:hypothetical protein
MLKKHYQTLAWSRRRKIEALRNNLYNLSEIHTKNVEKLLKLKSDTLLAHSVAVISIISLIILLWLR